MPELELGVGVVPVWGRHPVAMAAQVLTAAQGVPGGLTLGIGLSHPAMVGEHLGDDLYGKPLSTMREYLEVLVPLVTTGSVDHEGDLYTCRTTVALAGDDAPDRAGRRAGREDARARGPPRPRHHHVVDRPEHAARPRRARPSPRPRPTPATRRRASPPSSRCA